MQQIIRRWTGAGLALLLMTGLVLPAGAEIKLDNEGKVGLYGDFRLRLESDFDSANSSGGERNDRNRMRIRMRAGLNVSPTEKLKFGVRLRTGSDDSQQSPHITMVDFDDNDTGDAHFNFDKFFVSYSEGSGSFWAGRNGLPFWKQNELFWDDDVTPLGVAANFKFEDLKFNLGYFSLPVGMKAFSGNLFLGQAVYDVSLANDAGLTLAAGVLNVDGDPNDSDGDSLLDGNGARDYNTWILSAQYKTKLNGRGLKLGLDYLNNSEDYAATDPNPFTAFNRDETDGFVISLGYGGTSNPGDWLLAYYYADIGTFAASSSYSQDDWMRWGSATETRSTNFSGHEFRYAYGVAKNWNLVARLYVVEANVLRSASATSLEDGNRFRIDLNGKF